MAFDQATIGTAIAHRMAILLSEHFMDTMILDDIPQEDELCRLRRIVTAADSLSG